MLQFILHNVEIHIHIDQELEQKELIFVSHSNLCTIGKAFQFEYKKSAVDHALKIKICLYPVSIYGSQFDVNLQFSAFRRDRCRGITPLLINTLEPPHQNGQEFMSRLKLQ